MVDLDFIFCIKEYSVFEKNKILLIYWIYVFFFLVEEIEVMVERLVCRCFIVDIGIIISRIEE